jgi:hypothetical protein
MGMPGFVAEASINGSSRRFVGINSARRARGNFVMRSLPKRRPGNRKDCCCKLNFTNLRDNAAFVWETSGGFIEKLCEENCLGRCNREAVNAGKAGIYRRTVGAGCDLSLNGAGLPQ